jgi:transposase
VSPSPDFSSLPSAEKDALIATLLERLAALESEVVALRAENAALREKLKLPPKTPDNSSLPPSRGHKANEETAPKPKRKPHPGAFRALHPHPTRTRSEAAHHCQHCNADVSGVAQSVVHAYDRIEIPEIRPDVTRVELRGGTCPCCAKSFKAPPPDGLGPGSPFGPNLRAFLIYLRFAHAISFERLARLASEILGLEISEGALVNILADARPALAHAFRVLRARLLASTIICSDETSVRVEKKTWWTWTFHHADTACFVIDPHRSCAVVEGFLDGHRPRFWVSDRYGAQMGWASVDHQVCLAHLIRDAKYAIEAGDIAFAPALRALLQRACAIAGRRPDLTEATLRTYGYDLDRRLDDLLRVTPLHAKGAALKKAIKGCRGHLFVFLRNRGVPATNNGSEQALRPTVTFRKVTNCFRSKWAAELYAHIRSVMETARRRSIAILDAIRLALEGCPIPDTG